MSDPHKDVDVEDHVRTMMKNTGAVRDHGRRLSIVEAKQDDARERLSVVERVLRAVEELPTKVAELTAAANAVAGLPDKLAKVESDSQARDKTRNVLIAVFGFALMAINLGVGIWAVTR